MICPHCGSKIDEKALTSNVCPYCGGKLKDKSFPKFENVLPFKISERAAKRAMVEDLFDEDVTPSLFDIFTSPTQIHAYKAYIPMWVFKGNFDADWKGIKVISKRRYVNDDFGYMWDRVKQYPVSGSEHGDYCVAVSANSVNHIITSGDYLLPTKDSAELDSSVKILECNISKEKAFKGKELNAWLKDEAKKMLTPTIEEQEYEESNVKEEWDNVKYGVNYDYDECHLVLLPVWQLYYSNDDYEDMFCYYAIDATYGDVLESRFPERKASDEIEESIDISDIYEPMKAVGYMWIYLIFSAAAVLLSIMSFGGKIGIWQGGVMSALTAIFGIYIIIKTSLRQDKQEEEKKELIEARKEKARTEINSNLQNKPLFKSVLHMKSVPSREYTTDSAPYNSKVTRGKALLHINLWLLIALLLLSIGTDFVFAKINKQEEAQEQIDEQSQQSEFTVDSISYRVLSFDNMTVEVTNGKDCVGKVEIPSKVINGRNEYTVVQVGKEAFSGNRNIASVSLPNTVVSIMDAAFSGCNLASFTPSENLTYVSGTAFSDIFNMGASVPVLSQNGMVYLGKVAYRYVGDKEHLTSFTLREGTVSIADGAFQYCRVLTSVRLPNRLRSIGIRTFEECESLKSIILPRNVEYIGHEAFKHCYNLTSVTLFNNIEVIGQKAFDDTKWYKDIIGEKDYFHYAVADTTVTDSDNYESASQREETDNENYSVDGNFVYIGSVLYGTKDEVPYGTNLTVKEGTKGIAEYALNNCNGLVSVSLPSSIVCIGDGAFQNCKGLERINIPKRLEKVGKHSFEGCVSLKEDNLMGDNISCIGVYKDYVKVKK